LKNQRGGLGVELSGCRKGIRTPVFFINMLQRGGSKTQFGTLSNDDGVILSSESEIKEYAYNFFQSQFSTPEVEDMRNQFHI
jgi:hypothetical protein